MSLLVFLAACNGGETSVAEAAPDSGAAKSCLEDPDCTKGWDPRMPSCGPTERCFEGKCLIPPTITGKSNSQTGRVVFETEAGEKSYQVEIVQSRFETARGLMCRPMMKADWGMLFFMGATRVQSFWMKNTLTALDILFIDKDWNVVGVSANAVPKTLTGRTVGIPSLYVLELKAGEAAKAGIKAGVKARFYAPRPPGE